jgi:mono/diheme cytochrome c family protein
MKIKIFFVLIAASISIAFFTIACGETASSQTTESNEIDALTLYNKNCNLCHGKDGQKGMSGAANLAISVMSRDAKIEIITNGKGKMSAYGEKLNTQEIAAIADYLDQLKK